MQDKARWIFAVALLLSPIAGAGILVWIKQPDTAPPRPAAVLGRQGEWVTRPDGRRVCRLSADLRIGHRIDRSFCAEWQEPMPADGQPVEGWMRANPIGGYQIMIEGTWRP